MKKFWLFVASFFVASSFFVESSAFAQPSQPPVFYPPTWRVEKSEVKGNTRTEVIERRRFIVLGFLPRTSSGDAQMKTGALSSEDYSFSLTSRIKSRDFDGRFAALKTELLGIKNTKSKRKGWNSILAGGRGWGLIPSNTLRAAQNYGQMIYCIYTQRFTIVGVRDGENLTFQGYLDNSFEGPTFFVLTKMRRGNFDFTTLPTPREMEILDNEVHYR